MNGTFSTVSDNFKFEALAGHFGFLCNFLPKRNIVSRAQKDLANLAAAVLTASYYLTFG